MKLFRTNFRTNRVHYEYRIYRINLNNTQKWILMQRNITRISQILVRKISTVIVAKYRKKAKLLNKIILLINYNKS